MVGRESGANLGSGVTPARRYGRYGDARILEGVSEFFADQIIRFFGSSDAGGCGCYVHPSEAAGIGRGACVIGARFGVVIGRGSVGFDLAPRFASAAKRCTSRPFSPAAATAARRWR